LHTEVSEGDGRGLKSTYIMGGGGRVGEQRGGRRSRLSFRAAAPHRAFVEESISANTCCIVCDMQYYRLLAARRNATGHLVHTLAAEISTAISRCRAIFTGGRIKRHLIISAAFCCAQLCARAAARKWRLADTDALEPQRCPNWYATITRLVGELVTAQPGWL